MRQQIRGCLAILALAAAFGVPVHAQNAPAPLPPALAEFRGLYKELIEINTSEANGDCTVAAQAMAARLKAVGYPDADVHVIVPPGYPKRGNIVAVLHGTNTSAKAILLLAHLDVVNVKPEDWKRDPFKLAEEDGFFWGRGASDDKAMVAIFTDMMLRYKKEGYRPKRDIKMALTCGEETPADYDGARYLVEHERALIDAAFALNENGSGQLDDNGKQIAIIMQAGQKVQQHYQLQVIGGGGISSGPPRDTPLYTLARALGRIAEYEFPLNISASSRAYLTGMAKLSSGQMQTDMQTLLNTPPDAAAATRMRNADPRTSSMLRTTCVATMMNAGEAESALPQRATALLDCHAVPGESLTDVEKTLNTIVADPKVKITAVGDPGLPSPPPPVNETILGPARTVAAKMWPGVPLIPYQVNGADDGRFLTPAGIPTYGLSGLFRDPDGDGTHGVNERIRVRSLYEGRDFLYAVTKLYADAR